MPNIPGVFLLAAVASSAQPIRVPELAGGDVPAFASNLRSTPPDMRLIPHGDGARNGSVWIRDLGHSLGIWGMVDGPTPAFARNRESVLANDHVEVWLAGAADVPMSGRQIHQY